MLRKYGFLLAGMIILGTMVTSTPEPEVQQIRTSEFKNLRVLDKNITKDALKARMNSFTDYLGVKCTYCHILDEYEKDEKKHKLIAREMIKLVEYMKKNTIKFFPKEFNKEEISCWTCHKGSAEIKPYDPDKDWP